MSELIALEGTALIESWLVLFKNLEHIHHIHFFKKNPELLWYLVFIAE